MRQVTRKGLMTVAAATGVLAATGGYAHADSGASGASSNSPGVLSGNTVQAPVHVPVNVCGNTVNVVGLLNPAMGNTCVDHGGRGSSSDGRNGHGGHTGREARSGGGSSAGGSAAHSPGVGSGNHVQVPVDVPVNVCGNSVDVVGILNPSMGNDCANDSGPQRPPSRGHETPGKPGHHGPGKPEGPGESTPSAPERPTSPGHATPVGDSSVHGPDVHAPQLAHTGSGLPMGLAVPVGAGALLAGAVLYRKARPSA